MTEKTAPEPKRQASGALSQISMSYVPLEDRAQLILIVDNGPDMRFWITRRFARGLWGVLLKGMEIFPDLKRVVNEDARQAMMSMRHHDALQQSDFATPRQENSDLPKRVPMLVGAGVKPTETDGVITLTLKTRSRKAINLNLDERLLHALCHLLVETAVGAEWDLDLTVGDGVLAAGEGGKVLH
ncbi:hypothetical protein [Magnetospira sp. QH-2]|uniref:hypothetical protein n=1 Tax=Magnetospira sp. (strain QH-2) TaxID=1288970 RepID=UPI0003E80C50|nr:hypothetical protein [Magnetospira sp. QH-2]CCQ74885.1 protein of unknown function [Magnetospira sp. QH-2]